MIKNIKSILMEMIFFILTLSFYASTDVFAEMTHNRSNVRIYLMINYGNKVAQEFNAFFIATLVVLVIAIMVDIVILFLDKGK